MRAETIISPWSEHARAITAVRKSYAAMRTKRVYISVPMLSVVLCQAAAYLVDLDVPESCEEGT
jgi:hypothetical protein